MRKFKTALFEVLHDSDRLILVPAWGTMLPAIILLAFCAIIGLEIGLTPNLLDIGRALGLVIGLLCLIGLVLVVARGRAPYRFDLRAGTFSHGDKVLSSLENIARIELREENILNVTVYEVGFVLADDPTQKFHSLGSLTSTQSKRRDMEYIGQAFLLYSPLSVVDNVRVPIR